MSYRLAEWMYVDEPERECCPQTENVLSDGDKQGMAAAYPYDAQALDELLASRRTRLEALLGVEGLSGGRQQAVAQHLDQLG